jgi:hypothetical protein
MVMAKKTEKRDLHYEAEDCAILALIHKRQFDTLSPEDRAYTIIRAYIEVEDPDEELQTEFARWRQSRNAEAKERAFRTLIEQVARMNDAERVTPGQ